MIRKMKLVDLPSVMDIWLTSNIYAHSFINKQYWIENSQMVKEALPKADVYVYETAGEVSGFVGLDNGYIAGIFVDSEMQSQGVGTALLNACKEKHSQLILHVYKKNERAVKFYFREGFKIDKTGIDENTGEEEYSMLWIK